MLLQAGHERLLDPTAHQRGPDLELALQASGAAVQAAELALKGKFEDEAIGAGGLFLAALGPTLVALLCFKLL
mgnify:CR=1 FL=1